MNDKNLGTQCYSQVTVFYGTSGGQSACSHQSSFWKQSEFFRTFTDQGLVQCLDERVLVLLTVERRLRTHLFIFGFFHSLVERSFFGFLGDKGISFSILRFPVLVGLPAILYYCFTFSIYEFFHGSLDRSWRKFPQKYIDFMEVA